MAINRWSLLIFLFLFASAPLMAADIPCTVQTDICVSKLDRMFRERGWAGLEMLASTGSGFRIVRVLDGSPARRAGILYGDTVVAINGTRVSPGTPASLARLLGNLKPGKKATYTIARSGSETNIEVVLEAIPQDVRTRWITKYTKGGSATLEFS